jgi:hypothetical protein
MNAADFERMAENCESAARRLAASENAPDQRDAAAFAAVAKRHRATAERLRAEEEAARTPAYWWKDRD